jgi:hypothetical protein
VIDPMTLIVLLLLVPCVVMVTLMVRGYGERHR